MLPTLWFRNTWSWGRTGEGYCQRSRDRRGTAPRIVAAEHESLGRSLDPLDCRAAAPELLFTENETNNERLFGAPNATPYVKDAFHELRGPRPAGRVNPGGNVGTKARRRTG